jgi:beta-lactam-binding protein with PASTA domain
MSPSSDPASFRDAGLPVGQTWANPLGTMRVTLDSAGAAGATVTISSQLAKVPNLAGLKLAQARPALEAAGFAYGGVSEELDASCEFIGVIKSATPDFGSVVSRGTSVALHLGKEDPKHRCF